MSTMTWADAMANPHLKDLPFKICVEVMSPSNTWGEMHMKAGLYLEAGADEVWIQALDGERRVIRA